MSDFPNKFKYIIIYWINQEPLFSEFINKTEAERAASVRNAILMEVSKNFKINSIVDYYRRDKDDNPMPFKNRTIKNSGFIKGG